MENRIVFHMVFAHKKQKRSGNAEQALIEFVHARQKWREQSEKHFEEHGESVETWNNNPAGEEPGTKRNKFKAENGVTIWYGNWEHEQQILG